MSYLVYSLTNHVSETISECISEWAPFGLGCGGHAQHGAPSFTELSRSRDLECEVWKFSKKFLHNLHQVWSILIFKLLFSPFLFWVGFSSRLQRCWSWTEKRELAEVRYPENGFWMMLSCVSMERGLIGCSDFEFFDMCFSLVFDQFFSLWVG